MSVRGARLTVVGTGIDVTTQLAPGARAAIRGADTVFYVLADPVAALRVEALNPQARSLDGLYAPGKERRITYEEMVETVVAETLASRDVCLVTYGHPGVFAAPGHEAVARVHTHATLALLQVGMLGEAGGTPTGATVARFPLLVDLLRELYGPARECVLYEASPYPGVGASIIRFALDETVLPTPSVLTTLCVPPE